MSLEQVLHAPQADPGWRDDLSLYAFLVGEWRTTLVTHDEQGAHEGEGRIDAGWVLGGRAIQDVWQITSDPLPVAGKWFGTTLRLFDRRLGAWRIVWSDPARSQFSDQIGRATADGIEQLGAAADGRRSRWTFSDISSTAFHWRGYTSPDPTSDWTLAIDVFARRP